MPKILKADTDGISISPFTLITLIALVLLGYGITVLSYAAVLIPHEFAHAFVGEKLGYRVKRLRIMPYGIALSGDYEYIKPADEIRIAVMGPAVNFLFFLLCASLWWFFPITYSATKGIAEASLFTAILNMLPIFPMDGGRVLRGFLRSRLSLRKVKAVIRAVGIVTGVAAIVVAFAMLLTGASYTFATLGIFILTSLFSYNETDTYGRIYGMENMRLRLHGGLKVCEIMVDGDCTLTELFSMLRPDRYTKFIVCDKNGRPVFSIDESRLERLIAQFNCSDAVISVAKF